MNGIVQDAEQFLRSRVVAPSTRSNEKQEEEYYDEMLEIERQVEEELLQSSATTQDGTA